MAIAYLMLGSNLGNKLNNLLLATKAIESELGAILRFSAVYNSEPWGFTAPEDFCNQLIIIQTHERVETLMGKILKIEEGMGRTRISKEYRSRTIDIDILFYDEQIIQSENLTIPHAKIAERRFVLLPLLEMDSLIVHPITGKTVWEMYRECEDKLAVKMLVGSE